MLHDLTGVTERSDLIAKKIPDSFTDLFASEIMHIVAAIIKYELCIDAFSEGLLVLYPVSGCLGAV